MRKTQLACDASMSESTGATTEPGGSAAVIPSSKGAAAGIVKKERCSTRCKPLLQKRLGVALLQPFLNASRELSDGDCRHLAIEHAVQLPEMKSGVEVWKVPDRCGRTVKTLHTSKLCSRPCTTCEQFKVEAECWRKSLARLDESQPSVPALQAVASSSSLVVVPVCDASAVPLLQHEISPVVSITESEAGALFAAVGELPIQRAPSETVSEYETVVPARLAEKWPLEKREKAWGRHMLLQPPPIGSMIHTPEEVVALASGISEAAEAGIVSERPPYVCKARSLRQ